MGSFAFFLSHVSAHKVAVAELKKELKAWGVSAFIAHEDITPSSEWQNEIELALRSMQRTCCATDTRLPSEQVDRSRGRLRFGQVLCGASEVGFGSVWLYRQGAGIERFAEQPSRIAHLLFDILLSHPATHRHIRSGLAYAFGESGSYSRAISLSKIIATVTDFSDDEKAVIQRAFRSNDQVYAPPSGGARLRGHRGAETDCRD